MKKEKIIWWICLSVILLIGLTMIITGILGVTLPRWLTVVLLICNLPALIGMIIGFIKI